MCYNMLMRHMDEKAYICIDLKSFYASVECVDRGLDPLDTNLVVADPSRTEKTICLAVTPSMKLMGIPGRARLFEVIARVNEVNIERKSRLKSRKLEGSSCIASEISADDKLAVDYITAAPRMARYMEVSTQIYNIYLKYIAPEDIHIYSVDEVFIDVTRYGRLFKASPRELAVRMINDVMETTGITATVGIGTNLYLAKVAMDIEAKHTPPDKNGARIAELDEMSYRKRLWAHEPITDFWRVGRGIAARLEKYGIKTMGDIAAVSVAGDGSVLNEAFLYKLFGVNAELLIDHAWGWEPCTMEDIKSYRPRNHSLSVGQVLSVPYDFDMARLIVREMADSLAMDIFSKGLVTDQVCLSVGYDVENINDPEMRRRYHGDITTDAYGRRVPKSSHGIRNIVIPTSSVSRITECAAALFNDIADKSLLVRRITIAANNVMPRNLVKADESCKQLDMFSDTAEQAREFEYEVMSAERENRRQDAVLAIIRKFGKNAILRGMNFEKGATAIERNAQIGGHRADTK